MADILSFRPSTAKPAPKIAAPGGAPSARGEAPAARAGAPAARGRVPAARYGELIVFPNVGIVRLVALGRMQAVPATPIQAELSPRDALS